MKNLTIYLGIASVISLLAAVLVAVLKVNLFFVLLALWFSFFFGCSSFAQRFNIEEP